MCAALFQVEKTKAWGVQNKIWTLFITRFFGCNFCNGMTSSIVAKACRKAFDEHFTFSFCRFLR